MKKLDKDTLDKLLFNVNKPYQYAGNELHSYNKDFERYIIHILDINYCYI